MKQSFLVEPQRQQTRSSAAMATISSVHQGMVDNRDSSADQRQLKVAMANTPHAIAQRRISQQMHSSSRMLAQRKMLCCDAVQRVEEDESLQKKSEPIQRVEEEALQKTAATDTPAQLKEHSSAQPNNTGLPDNLKSGIESLSGLSMDSVRVHYNSPQPAQLNALAYAQGTDIHVAPGQEQHLPHEAWHVVQQAQGRVQPTMQMKDGVSVNDDQGLEKEADVMGARAISGAFQKKMVDGAPHANSLTGTSYQLKRYTVERNLKLDLGTKIWEKDKKSSQPAKTRARGQALAFLREMYPAVGNFAKDALPEDKDKTRGAEFLEARDRLDQKYKILDTDSEDQTAESTRTAIYRNAPEGERAKKSQALGVIGLTKRDDYIGAHLVKREWGGDDNMWNVVAWLESAEKKWAANFERPVDMKGVFGEDPGSVSISVQKEDELIAPDDYKAIAKDEKLTGTAYEKIAIERAKINRAVESVPLVAAGVNNVSTTTLNGTETGYAIAEDAGKKKFTSDVSEAMKITAERSDFGGKRPIPSSFEAADEVTKVNATKERREDWKKEKDTYNAGGIGAFDFTNTVFKESD
ncbi:eCIS core domain-containing protein [Nitrosomonas sp. wSCUT-2]